MLFVVFGCVHALQSNTKQHKIEDEVQLDLYVKNVKRLMVKVFEINTHGYYRTHLSEIPADINLV